MANNDDLILRSKALRDLEDLKEMLVAAGDPFFAAIMNRAIICIKGQPSAEREKSAWGADGPNYVCLRCGTTFKDELPYLYPGEIKLPDFCPACGGYTGEDGQNVGD